MGNVKSHIDQKITEHFKMPDQLSVLRPFGKLLKADSVSFVIVILAIMQK